MEHCRSVLLLHSKTEQQTVPEPKYIPSSMGPSGEPCLCLLSIGQNECVVCWSVWWPGHCLSLQIDERKIFEHSLQKFDFAAMCPCGLHGGKLRQRTDVGIGHSPSLLRWWEGKQIRLCCGCWPSATLMHQVLVERRGWSAHRAAVVNHILCSGVWAVRWGSPLVRGEGAGRVFVTVNGF